MLSALSNVAMLTPADVPVWGHGYSGQLSVFERMGRGAILVDGRARVLQINACVRLGDGLQVLRGFLRAPQPADRERLQRFLSAVLAMRSLPAAMTLTLPRPSGLRPWLLDGMVCSDSAPNVHAGNAALLLITDVERPARLTAERLAQVFGLTVTEANLARELAAGKSLQQASAELAISEGHARQRLKAIFEKTHTARQGELIALLAKLG
jgi:DNA-binding CsgD family transcriptional regulator